LNCSVSKLTYLQGASDIWALYQQRQSHQFPTSAPFNFLVHCKSKPLHDQVSQDTLRSDSSLMEGFQVPQTDQQALQTALSHSSLRYVEWMIVLFASGLSCSENYCPIRSLHWG
jgi:hypothetical protein